MNSLAVIIVNWNSYQNTKTCVESILKIRNQQVDIFIVDNNSSDNSLFQLKQEFGNILNFIKNNTNNGYCGGNNFGIKRILNKYDLFLILNNDTLIKSSSFFDNTFKAFNQDKNLYVLGYKIYDIETNEDKSINKTNILYRKLYNFIKPYSERKGDNAIYVSGSSITIRKESFYNIGFFDENFFMYVEEIDYCFRVHAKLKNVKILNNEGIYRKCTDKSNVDYVIYYKIRNSILFLKKHLRIKQITYFLPYIFPFLFIQLIRTKFSLKNLYIYFWGMIHGIINKKGKNTKLNKN